MLQEFVLERYGDVEKEFEDLDKIKEFLHINSNNNSDDLLLTKLIVFARESCEQHIGSSLVKQGWHVKYEALSSNHYELFYGPYISIDKVSIDAVVMDNTNYNANLIDGYVSLKRSVKNNIEIIYSAGVSKVPVMLYNAMLQHICFLYRSDRDKGALFIPTFVKSIYDKFRHIRF